MTKRGAVSVHSSEEDYVKKRHSARMVIVANHPVEIEIVSNIPSPLEARGGCRKFDHYYPFEKMKVGDSFWVPSDTGCTPGAVTKFAKKSGWSFITRAQTKDGRKNSEVFDKTGTKRGTRVWRTA